MNDARYIFGWLVRLLRVLQFLAIFPLQEACETSQCLRLYLQILIRQLIFMPLMGTVFLGHSSDPLLLRSSSCLKRKTYVKSVSFLLTNSVWIHSDKIEQYLNPTWTNWVQISESFVVNNLIQACWDFDDSGGISWIRFRNCCCMEQVKVTLCGSNWCFDRGRGWNSTIITALYWLSFPWIGVLWMALKGERVEFNQFKSQLSWLIPFDWCPMNFTPLATNYSREHNR
jgi:hypothetical protein